MAKIDLACWCLSTALLLFVGGPFVFYQIHQVDEIVSTLTPTPWFNAGEAVIFIVGCGLMLGQCHLAWRRLKIAVWWEETSGPRPLRN
jgi:hypothetical protein